MKQKGKKSHLLGIPEGPENRLNRTSVTKGSQAHHYVTFKATFHPLFISVLGGRHFRFLLREPVVSSEARRPFSYSSVLSPGSLPALPHGRKCVLPA